MVVTTRSRPPASKNGDRAIRCCQRLRNSHRSVPLILCNRFSVKLQPELLQILEILNHLRGELDIFPFQGQKLLGDGALALEAPELHLPAAPRHRAYDLLVIIPQARGREPGGRDGCTGRWWK